MEKAVLTNMPIQALQQVSLGRCHRAIVPSIYAQRADDQTLFKAYPIDGAIALPSYIAVNRSVTQEEGQLLLEHLLQPQFCNYFVQKADILCCIAGSQQHAMELAGQVELLYPSKTWLEQIDVEHFDQYYWEEVGLKQA